MTTEQLKEMALALSKASHALNVQRMKFELAMAEFAAEHLIPEGHGPDLFGDGKVKPLDQCKKFEGV